MTQPALFEHSRDELLISVYQKQGRTLDDLPYTPEFDAIYQAISDKNTTPQMIFHQLHNLRKAGGLPRLGRAAEKPPRVSADHETFLIKLVEQAIGKLSLRDQLPYTPAFDQVVTSFNAQAGMNLSPHAVWRLVAKLAK